MDWYLFMSTITLYLRFALFEADRSGILPLTNPRLRRCAPYLGLTMWHLSEVLIG